jgi:hypothetical protein
MPLPLTSDLADILNLDEFAVTASYQRKGAAGDSEINVIFDNETVPVDAGGFVQVHQEQPRVNCRTTDIPYISETDKMLISGVLYIVRAWIHDGTGMTVVQLEKT